MMGCFYIRNIFHCSAGLLQVEIFHFHDFHQFDLCNLQVSFESGLFFLHFAMYRFHFHDLVIGKPHHISMLHAHAHHIAHLVHISHFHPMSMPFPMPVHGHIFHLGKCGPRSAERQQSHRRQHHGDRISCFHGTFSPISSCTCIFPMACCSRRIPLSLIH